MDKTCEWVGAGSGRIILPFGFWLLAASLKFCHGQNLRAGAGGVILSFGFWLLSASLKFCRGQNLLVGGLAGEFCRVVLICWPPASSFVMDKTCELVGCGLAEVGLAG